MPYKLIGFNATPKLQRDIKAERKRRLEAGRSRMESTQTAIILDALHEYLHGEDA
jgi:hypothetical protein